MRGVSHTSLFGVALVVGCGGSAESSSRPDAPSGPSSQPDARSGSSAPVELADDERPYALAASCAELPVWPALRDIRRVAAVSPREAWAVTGDRKLFHLVADGSIELEPLGGVVDVRRCEGVTWAVGAEGLVARKPDGGAWERLDLVATAPYTDVDDAGVGCDGDVWLGLGLAVHVHDGTSWRTIPTEPTYFDPADPAAGKVDHDTFVVRGAARYRVATSHYGHTLAYFHERDAFAAVAGTDSLISDAVAFSDGTGATLYYGFALAFDRDAGHKDRDSAFGGTRVSRRNDADVWVAASTEVRHLVDGIATAVDQLPGLSFNADVDARFDSVWVVGFDGIAVRSQAGWCHVLVTPRIE